jgi:hypothetical protein
MRGGKDGGSGTYPLYSADRLSGSGFTCVARIITKGTITAQHRGVHGASVTTSARGRHGRPCDTSGATPAYDNNYTARFDISVTITVPSGGGMTARRSSRVESNDGVHGWIERATRSFVSSIAGAGTQTSNYTGQEVAISDSTLLVNDQIRLKLKSITVSGPGGSTGGATLTGYDNTGGNGHGVEYNTNSGGTNVTKTPDADDFIFWESFEVVT